ncbi:MAG: hydroxymethylglutaryl-CoA synthase [Myxococcota bacterium]|nr:hydroxymethylglutaryl-CoA synthase [Myxococcota bacterium]
MIERLGSSPFGISGFALCVPRPRVQLAQWCRWTGRSWPALQARVGESFRLCGPGESIYTLAAGAVLRLIRAHDVDPRRVGLLALGTESSTDNSAGAVILKGMLDEALVRLGRPPLARSCEVPEVKHACLGGVYALKAALRYVAGDGRGRQAIVVAADRALYARGSTGEETQGAGAVALLVEEAPRLLTVDLLRAGSVAQYRGPDFRKPLLGPPAAPGLPALPRENLEHPVFNGRYTTVCYIDGVRGAVEELLARSGLPARRLYHEVAAVFMHRPYHRLPYNALAALYLWALREAPEHQEELKSHCDAAEVDFGTVMAELASHPDLYAGFLAGQHGGEVYAAAMQVARHFRTSAKFAEVVAGKMRLGVQTMRELGNLYSAALPAWIAAGLVEARAEGVELAGELLLAIGYGSGDAAEALPLRVVPGWQQAAGRIGLTAALAAPLDLDAEQYAALHAGGAPPGFASEPAGGFAVARVGTAAGPTVWDLGVDYHRFQDEGQRPDPTGSAVEG